MTMMIAAASWHDHCSFTIYQHFTIYQLFTMARSFLCKLDYRNPSTTSIESP